MRRAVVAAVLVCAVVALGACRGGDVQRVALDGSPRHPDAEGVVESVTRDELVLDGDRRYSIGDELQSFSSQTMQAVPVLQREGQYVHIGVDGDRLVWIAAIGSIVPGDPPTVYYTGVVEQIADGSVIFDDGTVLRLADDATTDVETGAAIAEIDPVTKRVRVLRTP